MKPYPSLKHIIAELLPLHRTIVSDDMDKTLEIIGSYLPDQANYALQTYSPGTPIWTWVVPERYIVHAAYLETESGKKVVDFADNPLHIISYSLPIDKTLTWDELEPHLRYNEKFPDAIPWEFKYYERDWGFCLPKNQFDKLDRTARYHAVIDVEFARDPELGLKIGHGVLHPEGGAVNGAGEIIVQAHSCHPMQANDDLAGVVSTIELARRLAEKPLPAGSMSVRFWFGPETIGTIAYLAHNEELIPNLQGGIFMEMTGNKNKLAWHHSRQHDHLLDRITQYVLRDKDVDERDFAAAPANDERVINGPGVNVPCISLNRFPYDEYHTTEDNLNIMDEAMLQGAADVAEEIIRIFASNYIPKRTFRGPVFLSGHGLWVDWRENWNLNRAIEKIMMRFEGQHSIFDIAEQTGLDYWETYEYVEKFREKGFVTRLPIKSEAHTS